MSSPFTAFCIGRKPVLRFFRKIGPTILLGVLVLSADVHAAEAPLTLAEAQRRAVERSGQLAAQDFAVSASRDMAVAAGQLPDPVLKAGVDNLPVNGPDRLSLTSDFMTQRRIGVMQEVTRADKRRLRAERFERDAEKAIAQKSMTAAAIERDTALAWLDLYYAQAMATVVAEQGSQARLEVQSAEGAYRAGRGNQADVFAARSALAMFEDRASEIQRRIRNARTMLARWIGDAADLPLAGAPAIDAIRLDPATLDTQLAHHPQIAVLAKQEEIATTEAKLAQANKKPDWSVELAYQQRGPSFSNMVSIGVSIPLQWDQRNRQDRELSSKLALVEQAKAERDDTLRAHVAETRTMINEWENNRERHARYERELIPLANERTQAAIAAYRGGKASLADVLAARRNEIDVRIQALQLATDTARIWAQINFLFPTNDIAAHAAMVTDKDTK
jgi:outer membrane protein TolC